MSSIAAELGGSKATLYKYFPSREALFEAVMVQCCEELFVEFPAADLSRTDDVSKYLIDVGSKVLEAMLKPSALDISRLVFSEGARHPEIAEIFHVKGVEPTYALVAEGLAHFHALGQIVCPAPLNAAKQFVGMVRGNVHLRALCGLETRLDDAALRAHVAQAAAVLIAGAIVKLQ